MKTGAGLALVAIGAILAFAVTAHPTGLNLQAAGWVLIVVGLAGMFVPRRGYGWLRRRMVVRPRRAVLSDTSLPAVAVPLDAADPAVYPGRQLSKAEAEEMGLTTPVAMSETIDEFRQE
jgi:uncharacterized protein DUF6458